MERQAFLSGCDLKSKSSSLWRRHSSVGRVLVVSCSALVWLGQSLECSADVFELGLNYGSDPIEVVVDVTEVAGDLLFNTEIDATMSGNIADLRGLFFHISDESLLSGLNASGTEVENQEYAANSVNNLGQGANVNGGIINDSGPFDVGIEFGKPGTGGGDDFQTTTFTLSHDTASLSLSSFFDTSPTLFMAARATSTGAENGPRSGSSKVAIGDFSPGSGVDPLYYVGVQVPEPASISIWILLGLGFATYVYRTRKRLAV